MAEQDRRVEEARTSVQAAIADAERSGSLRLSDVTLGELPTAIRSLRHLRELSVHNCGLTALPPWVGELTALERVDLANNPIDELPSALGALPALRVLGLSNTRLGELSPSFRELRTLAVLVAPGTAIRSLPPWIGELGELRAIDLGATQIAALPDGFERLQRLTHLRLWGHRFTQLPEAIRSLSRLETLDVSGRGHMGSAPVEELPAASWREPFRSVTQLVADLTLDRGELTALPEWLAELSSLRALNASDQHIAALPERLPPALEGLWLAANQLRSVPRSIAGLPRLRALDLTDNELSHVPAELAALSELRHLSLVDNPLGIPPEVLSSVTEPRRILDFVTRADGPTRRLDEAKLLVVGEGSVGKTSLVRRLVSDSFDEHQAKTEGIDVRRWRLGVAGGPVQLNVWDFGGQEIMHATHQFFLTKRSLYVLVIDARQGEEQNRIEYWLKLIHSYGGASPVVIVGNKIEQSVLDIDERGLMAKYPNVIDILPVSCLTGGGVERLRGRLAAALEDLPHVRDELPAPFFEVKRELEQLDADFVTYPSYEQMCARRGIASPSAQESLVGFLHDLGTVLCFRDDPRLSDTNILNPEWVTGGVYALLNSHLAAQKKGLLRWRDVDEVLDAAAYPTERRHFIVDVMRRFELCYESDGTFLIPDLLTKQEPDTGAWNDALVFEVRYDVLPPSVLSRLIVRMHPMISRGTVWRTGLVVALDGNRALVKGDREDAVIRIAVDGPTSGRRGLLAAVRSELRAIGDTMPGMAGEERVPVPGADGVFVPYAHLLELEEAGHETVVPQGGAVRAFRVRDLLDGVESPSARMHARGARRSIEAVPAAEAPHADEAPPWTPAESMRLLGWLLAAVVVLVVVFVAAAALLGAAVAAGVTSGAVLAMALVAAIVLRSSGRLSEAGFLSALRATLARTAGPDDSR